MKLEDALHNVTFEDVYQNSDISFSQHFFDYGYKTLRLYHDTRITKDHLRKIKAHDTEWYNDILFLTARNLPQLNDSERLTMLDAVDKDLDDYDYSHLIKGNENFSPNTLYTLADKIEQDGLILDIVKFNQRLSVGQRYKLALKIEDPKRLEIASQLDIFNTKQRQTLKEKYQP